MTENYEHYISRTIQSVYRRRLIPPILFLLFIGLLWVIIPIHTVIFPETLTSLSDMRDYYTSDELYVTATVKNLKFTGYTKSNFGQTVGYYYYTENPTQNECCIILLEPNTCEQGLPNIDSISIYGKILYSDATYDTLLENLSGDLSWTTAGIRTKVNPYYLSEPDFGYRRGSILIILLAIGSLYAVLSIVICVLYILQPVFSPPCRVLGYFGSPRELLAQAEEELVTLPQLATEDMFITEHFFIETSKYGIAIVPIEEIIWIYKHSTLHKLFWYHFSISYTLNIVANKHVYIHCPKNIKSDIDGIIDYLAEANHDILVGFDEENRQRINELQGNPYLIEKIITLLKKRI